MRESTFQIKVIKRIHKRLPEALVIKNDPNYLQGVPDLTIFFKRRWATLETKKSLLATKRPNQDYYVNLMNEMSFSSFISPENIEEVLDDMERSLRA